MTLRAPGNTDHTRPTIIRPVAAASARRLLSAVQTSFWRWRFRSIVATRCGLNITQLSDAVILGLGGCWFHFECLSEWSTGTLVSAMSNAQFETKHHHSGQRVLVAVTRALALLAALSVSPLIASAAAEANPVPAPVSNTSQHATATTTIGRGAPRVPAAAEGKVCAKCAPPLLYHAGPVMGSTPTVGEVTVTPIFWAPPGRRRFPRPTSVSSTSTSPTSLRPALPPPTCTR